ncbi:hypothetical protein LLEC1_02511 [Akanthomyces lecanii]|uniref:Beta-glucuronidase C-terminal domain-containing protein n=1 Tax=Cordyceps confragosa TaxID=2714763 RepID=A0A179IJ20_CORDF|nr:hypothetical protein LLEC1_02511 [Akanthomyces lecanii]
MASKHAFSLVAALSLASVVDAAALKAPRDETSQLQIPAIQVDPSRFIDPDFPALAFEQASFVNYALNDDGTPNAFSQNLVDAIFSRTGGKPLIRLGGTSADYARYVANQTAPALPRAEVNSYQRIGSTKIGPAYWDIAANSFPKAQYIIQVPMANPDIAESVARHYYQTDGGHADTLASGLMNHGAITSRLDVYRDDLEFLAGQTTKTPYVLSEVGNSLNRKHDYAYQATLGSALWQVDFQLYGLSLGITRFHFQQILHAGFDMWLPGASGNLSAQVFANYYAQPFVADFVGAAGNVQVKNVPLEPNVAAYVAYEGGTPKRAAIVNLKYWSKCRSRGEARLAQYVRVQVPAGVTKVKVVHLTSPKGASAKAKTVTYAGSQWTYESQGKEVTGVRNDGDVLNVVGGVVDVPVKASEAVIVHFM